MRRPGVPPIQVPIEELEGLLEQARPALSAEGYQKLHAMPRGLGAGDHPHFDRKKWYPSKMRCPSCQAELRDPARFCPQCAAPLDAAPLTQTIAATRRNPPSSSSASSDEDRFTAGTTRGERYRVSARSDRARPRRLERFHGEVRISRQISHANVCRMFDLGEIGGSPFISMEYVDGEGLGSLPYVRRRWPATLVSWSRLLAGGFRDPLVGRDVLAGRLLGAFSIALQRLGWFVPAWLGHPPTQPYSGPQWLGARTIMADITVRLPAVLVVPLAILFVLFLLRALLRKEWAAAVEFVLLFTVVLSAPSHCPIE